MDGLGRKKRKVESMKKVPAVKYDVIPPRQLMIQGGKVVTVDGEEATINGFKDGTEVNIVARSYLEQLERDAAMAKILCCA